MLSVRMRLVLLMAACVGITKGASIKKSIKDSLEKETTVTAINEIDSTSIPTTHVPAIIAIEIINGSDSSSPTKSTSKRTIESSLGYGLGYGAEPPKKFVIYKYSQHDIPAHARQKVHYNGYNQNRYTQATIQKGIGYHLGSTSTTIEQQPSVELKQSHSHLSSPQYYNPANTVYTTLNHQGQLGGLSNIVPYQNLGHTAMVPVIILRVYTNQLESPNTALHTNLPATNPYASLNHINLQELLQTYVQQYLQQHFQAPVYQQPNYHQVYQETPQNYPVANDYHSSLPTSENYPTKDHTRVIFHSDNNGHLPEPQKIAHNEPSHSSYKAISVSSMQPSYEGIPGHHYLSSAMQPQQSYMYVYPSQLGQGVYYQQDQNIYYQPYEEQNASGDHSEEPTAVNGYNEKPSHVPPTATQESPDTPFNYHAHPEDSSRKYKRAKSLTSESRSTRSSKHKSAKVA